MSNWSTFYQGHGKQNYTPVFNSFLDSQIADPRVSLIARVLAWVLRNSWGRHSDACVDGDGVRLGQVDCARDLRLLDRKKGEPDRKKINPVFGELERLNLVLLEGREIKPVDNPLGLETFASSSNLVGPQSDKPDESEDFNVAVFTERVWKLANPAAYAEYQNVERRYKELRTSLVNDYKAFRKLSERGPTNDEDCPNGVRHDVGKGSDKLSERGATSPSASLYENFKPSLRPSSSFSLVREAIRQYAPEPDDDVLTQMVQACRDACGDCSEPEIAHFVHVKARLLTPRVANPVGFLLKAVPRCFERESIRAYREGQRTATNGVPHREPTQAEEIEALESLLSASPKHAQADEWREHLLALKHRKPAESEHGAEMRKVGQA